jgi:hypothetical protein
MRTGLLEPLVSINLQNQDLLFKVINSGHDHIGESLRATKIHPKSGTIESPVSSDLDIMVDSERKIYFRNSANYAKAASYDGSTGRFSASKHLAAQGASGGYSFIGDGDVDTGLFSTADGELLLRSNGSDRIWFRTGETANSTYFEGKIVAAQGVDGGYAFRKTDKVNIVNDFNTGMFSNSSGELIFKTNGTTKMWTNSTDDYDLMYFSGKIVAEQGVHGGYSFAHDDDYDTGMFSTANGELLFKVNGVDRFWTDPGDTTYDAVYFKGKVVAAQGSFGGYSFINDDGYDTGMFSTTDGQLILKSNGSAVYQTYGANTENTLVGQNIKFSSDINVSNRLLIGSNSAATMFNYSDSSANSIQMLSSQSGSLNNRSAALLTASLTSPWQPEFIIKGGSEASEYAYELFKANLTGVYQYGQSGYLQLATRQYVHGINQGGKIIKINSSGDGLEWKSENSVVMDGLMVNSSDPLYKETVSGVQYLRIRAATAAVGGYVTSGDQTIAGAKTFTSTIVGSITGNAATVTNGVYTTGDQTIAGAKTFSSIISGSINGNAATVSNGVYTTGDQTIAGAKTFSSEIAGSVSGYARGNFVNAATCWSSTDPAFNFDAKLPGSEKFKLFQAAGNSWIKSPWAVDTSMDSWMMSIASYQDSSHATQIVGGGHADQTLKYRNMEDGVWKDWHAVAAQDWVTANAVTKVSTAYPLSGGDITTTGTISLNHDSSLSVVDQNLHVVDDGHSHSSYVPFINTTAGSSPRKPIAINRRCKASITWRTTSRRRPMCRSTL